MVNADTPFLGVITITDGREVSANAEFRKREYLTTDEMNRLLKGG